MWGGGGVCAPFRGCRSRSRRSGSRGRCRCGAGAPREGSGSVSLPAAPAAASEGLSPSPCDNGALLRRLPAFIRSSSRSAPSRNVLFLPLLALVALLRRSRARVSHLGQQRAELCAPDPPAAPSQTGSAACGEHRWQSRAEPLLTAASRASPLLGGFCKSNISDYRV